MLELIQILFILFVTLFIGWHVGRSVPDEIVPARKYLELGLDALLLVMVGLAIYAFGELELAFIIPAALILGRRLFPLRKLYLPLSGIIVAAATLLPAHWRVILVVLCLALNFLIGAMAADMHKLARDAAWQPGLAILLAIALLFV